MLLRSGRATFFIGPRHRSGGSTSSCGSNQVASRRLSLKRKRSVEANLHGNPIGRASVSWHAGARFPTGPRRPHGHAHVTCDAYFSFISFSLREPSHQTKAAATGTSDAAVLNQKLVWYCESRKWQRLPFFLFFFQVSSFTFYYV